MDNDNFCQRDKHILYEHVLDYLVIDDVNDDSTRDIDNGIPAGVPTGSRDPRARW
jgi:hypothetical protein